MSSTGEISADLVLNDKTSAGLAAVSSSFKAAETTLTKSATNIGSNFSSTLANAFNKTGISSIASGIANKSVSVSKSLGIGGTAAISGMAAGLTAIGATAAKTFMGFDDQMRKVQAVTSATDSEFQNLTKTAKTLGATTSFTAQESAQAMIYLGQAGFDANQIIAAMPATLNLARGSMTDLATTADIMSNIMNGFQIPAQNTAYAADVLAAAANKTNTDVTGLGQAMKYAAPLAHQMGWSLQETAAAAGLLSNAGIKADMAGTVLRNSITRLIAPTDKVVGILDSYGISLDMVNPKTKGLADILDTLTAAGVSSGDMMEIFGMRAGPGMMALLNQGTDAIRAMEAELGNSKGYAAEAAAEMDKGFGGAVRNAENAVEAMTLSFGQAIATVATPLLNAFSAIGKEIAMVNPAILVAVAAMGMLVVAGLAAVAGLAGLGFIITGLEAAFVALGIAEAGSAIALSAAIWPITLAVGAIGLLVAAIYVLEEKTGLVSYSWNLLKDLFTITVHGILEAAGILKDGIAYVFDEIKSYISDLFPPGFLEGVGKAIDGIIGQFSSMGKNIHETAEGIRKENEGIDDSFSSWGDFDPSLNLGPKLTAVDMMLGNVGDSADTTTGSLQTVDSMLGTVGESADTTTGSLESAMNVDSGATEQSLAAVGEEMQEVINYGPDVYNALSQAGSVSFDDLNSSLFEIQAQENAVAETATEMKYIISDAGNVRMDGTNSQLIAINDNGSMSSLTIQQLKGYLEGTSNVSQGGTIAQLGLVDSTGKMVNLTTQQAIQLLQQAGNQPLAGTVAGWKNVDSAINTAIGDAYRFIEVTNDVAASMSKIGAAYKTTAEMVGNVSSLAGKWNTTAKLGKSSSGGSGTGEGNVKVVDKNNLYSSTTNVKIGTVNNNGSSTSTAKMKKAGV